jgi:hypothetical protein
VAGEASAKGLLLRAAKLRDYRMKHRQILPQLLAQAVESLPGRFCSPDFFGYSQLRASLLPLILEHVVGLLRPKGTIPRTS